MRKLLTAFVAALLVSACGGGDEPDKINVYCASSMTDAVGALGWEYDQEYGLHVNYNFGASSTLAHQISDGAPAHVYLSASRDWMDYLDEKGMLEGKPKVFAKNRLVLIGHHQQPKVANFDALLTDTTLEVAIADEGVPAGEYARQALKNAGVLDAVKPKLVGQKDVRAVVDAVGRGRAQYGIVYVTDIEVFEQSAVVQFRIPAKLHDPINCYIARIKGSPDYVKDYVNFMLSDRSHAILKKNGFAVP